MTTGVGLGCRYAILAPYQLIKSVMNSVQEGTPHTCTGILHARNVHTALVLVLVLLAAFLFAETIKSLKEYRYVGGGIPTSNAITVTGEGEVFAIPDTAEFTFTVEESADTVTAVQERVGDRVNAALDALRGEGIEDSNIRTVSFELHPKYEWQPLTCVRYPCDQRQVQRGFTLAQSIQVKVKDLGKAGDVLERVTATGVQNVSGLSFTLADEEVKRAEARALAIEEARKKADQLADDLGVALVRIVGFSEGGSYPEPYLARDMVELQSGIGGAAPKAAPLPSGENRIASNVSITYEIR